MTNKPHTFDLLKENVLKNISAESFKDAGPYIDALRTSYGFRYDDLRKLVGTKFPNMTLAEFDGLLYDLDESEG